MAGVIVNMASICFSKAKAICITILSIAITRSHASTNALVNSISGIPIAMWLEESGRTLSPISKIVPVKVEREGSWSLVSDAVPS